MVLPGSGHFQVMLQNSKDSWDSEVVLTGYIHVTSCVNAAAKLPIFSRRTDRSVTKTQFRDIFEQAGYMLGEEFSLVEGIERENGSTPFTILCIWKFL